MRKVVKEGIHGKEGVNRFTLVLTNTSDGQVVSFQATPIPQQN